MVTPPIVGESSMKKLVVLMLCSLILGCDQPPTFHEMKMNFEQNENTFSEIKSYVCKMGETGLSFSYSNGIFYYDTARSKQANVATVQYLDERLSKVGTTNVTFKKGSSDACNIEMQVFVAGFAGSGVSYGYKYNVDSPNTPSSQGFTLDNFPDSGRLNFDEPLGNDWYISYYQN